MEAPPRTRIQLCGRVVVRLQGRRIEDELPGRQGKLLFVYLVANRSRWVRRAELVDALWTATPPAAAESALSALLSRVRRVLGSEVLRGKSELRLELPPDAWIDFEAATEAVHRAESAVAQEDWWRAWGPAHVAVHTANRGFLPDHDAPWVHQRRAELEEVGLRGLECIAATGLGLGTVELATATRAARRLVREAPFRESGHRFLMEALALDGNVAEALKVYEDLRCLLRDELGIAPGPALQELHRRLLERRVA